MTVIDRLSPVRTDFTFPFLKLSLVASEGSLGKFLLVFPSSLLY